MLIDLVDLLRCPRRHDETWLVASAVRTDGRDIREGILGCPVCHAEYPIVGGVVWFDGIDGAATSAPPARDAELAIRIAAYLDLGDSRGLALLCGSYAPLAESLADVVPLNLVALNPEPFVATGQGVSTLIIARGIPLATASCRGVALDAVHAERARDDAVRVLQPRGRLVAPAATPLPDGVSEIARDDDLWIAERSASPPALVSLRGRGS